MIQPRLRNLWREQPLPKPIWIQGIGLVLPVASGVLIFAVTFTEILRSDSEVGSSFGPFLLSLSATVLCVALGIACWRVRPNPGPPVLFHLLFVPVVAYGACILVWTTILFIGALLDANPSGLWDMVFENVGTVLLAGLVGGWAWSALLFIVARRALMLFLVFLIAPLWLVLVAGPVINAAYRPPI